MFKYLERHNLFGDKMEKTETIEWGSRYLAREYINVNMKFLKPEGSIYENASRLEVSIYPSYDPSKTSSYKEALESYNKTVESYKKALENMRANDYSELRDLLPEWKKEMNDWKELYLKKDFPSKDKYRQTYEGGTSNDAAFESKLEDAYGYVVSILQGIYEQVSQGREPKVTIDITGLPGDKEVAETALKIIINGVEKLLADFVAPKLNEEFKNAKKAYELAMSKRF